MRLPILKRTLRLALLCLALQAGGVLPGLALPWLASVGGIVAVSSPAAAQSSGGYSRPGGGGSSGGYGSSGSFDRRLAIGSGGYGRPSSSPSLGGFGVNNSRGGDRAISRRASSQALQDYRASQTPSTPVPTPADRRPSAAWGGDGWATAPRQRRPPPSGWGAGAYAPSYVASAPRFGAWDAVLAWSLLNSLSRPQAVAYFQDSRDDPRYTQWRAEAERKAANDPAVAQKLAELDALMSQSKAQPVTAQTPPPDAGGGGVMIIVVFFGGAVLVGLWLLRRRSATIAAGGAMGSARSLSDVTSPPRLSGSVASRFRVGMTFPVDPSPFVLAKGTTKVKAPAADGMISVAALGLITDGPVSLHRLYLPGGEAFFVLHLGRDGTPDECRYFSLLDQITPASGDEWGFWLAPADGMIGWPQFQTKDGKTYDRVWAPGSERVPPRQQTETLQALQGTTQRKIQAMLYGAHTGAAAPAPETEYVLVSAIEQSDQAWIEVHAGIDINPAALSLPAVPLDS